MISNSNLEQVPKGKDSRSLTVKKKLLPANHKFWQHTAKPGPLEISQKFFLHWQIYFK